MNAYSRKKRAFGNREQPPYMDLGGLLSREILCSAIRHLFDLIAWQPDDARQRLCPVSATSRVGRRREFGNQRHSVRPGQSQRPQRPQRHRKRLADSAARHQCPSAGDHLRIGQHAVVARSRRDAILCRSVATDHQPASGPIKKATCPPSRTDRDQQIHRYLPGLLGPYPDSQASTATHSPGDLRHLGLRPLEIGCLPTRSDQQEQRSTSVITGSRPGLFPSAHDGRSVLIAQSPVPAPTALDDDKFQHRSTKPRMTRIIPNRTSLLGTTLANVQVPDVGNGALSNERHAIQPVENETPAGRDRRGRLGKMVRGWGSPRCRAKDPPRIPTPSSRFLQDDFVSNRGHVACRAARAQPSRITGPNDYSAMRDVVLVRNRNAG